MVQPKYLSLYFLIGLMSYLCGAQSTPQQCTAIQVPKSTNMPVRVNGKKTDPPVNVSKAFTPIVSTVQLPRGFKAVGGGNGVVIACR